MFVLCFELPLFRFKISLSTSYNFIRLTVTASCTSQVLENMTDIEKKKRKKNLSAELKYTKNCNKWLVLVFVINTVNNYPNNIMKHSKFSWALTHEAKHYYTKSEIFGSSLILTFELWSHLKWKQRNCNQISNNRLHKLSWAVFCPQRSINIYCWHHLDKFVMGFNWTDQSKSIKLGGGVDMSRARFPAHHDSTHHDICSQNNWIQ